MMYEGKRIWVVLETYDRTTDELLGECRIDHLVDMDRLIPLVGASSIEDLLVGGWRVEGNAARQLEAELATTIDEVQCEHFIAAMQPPLVEGAEE